jgi:hypothetical protein
MLLIEAIEMSLTVTSKAAVISFGGNMNTMILMIEVAIEDIINSITACALSKPIPTNINKTVKYGQKA